LQVCQSLAGFTSGQAEARGRAMSRRRSRELMAEFWEEFRDGAAARGVPQATAERVFTQVIAFSEFGFPKSHAAAFGLLAYQSAWLRHYHPAEYYCALFNNQPMGFYSLDVLGRDAERNGVEIRLPDVNASDVWCTIEKGAGSGEQVRPRLERGDGDGGRDRARAARAVREYRRLRAPGAAQAQAHRDRASRVGGGMRRLRAHPARAPVASGAVASSGSGARRGRTRPAAARVGAQSPARGTTIRRPRGGRAAARRV